jgi:hypothetical protein
MLQLEHLKLTVIIPPLKSEIIYKNPVRASQETHYVSATESNRLMLFREIIAAYCENHTEHINTLCGQNAEIIIIADGTLMLIFCVILKLGPLIKIYFVL